jgi:hypothetical protein
MNELEEINISALLVVRNYIGGKIGLAPMQENDLRLSFLKPNITVGVYYTIPES